MSEFGRDGLLSAAFTGNVTVAKLMLALGPEAKLHKYDALGTPRSTSPLVLTWQKL